LANYVQKNLYSEGPILTSPHLITVQTDDDELMVAYYIFDDHYIAEYPARAPFLLHEGWQLPGGHADRPFRPKEPTQAETPAGKGAGATYWTCEAWEDSCNLEDLGPARRIDGVRVPDLALYLARPTPSTRWSGWWLLLRSQLLAEGSTGDRGEKGFLEALLDDPDHEATWAAYPDWLEEQGLPPAGLMVLERALRAVTRYPFRGLPQAASNAVEKGTVRQARAALESAFPVPKPGPRYPHNHDPAKSLVHVEGHLAQLCVHVGHWQGQGDLYQQWIFFDDRWAAAHRDLANSILRFTRCWDMLSADGSYDVE
jgi:uncharacterized protein (TIGR02996 family)